jgi:molybdate transport system ATP-binding protein
MTIAARFQIDHGEFRLAVDATVPARGVTGLYGPSGCGKTTLLRAIAGLDRHAGGYLRVGDTIWQDGREFVPPHRRRLGYVFQEPSLFAHLSVRGNLAYGETRVPPAERKVSLERAIELLGIGQLLDRRPDGLSGGERQRVAIARALAVSPRLLLMDEPLASLDQARKQEILPYLESLHQELDCPVLYVSHSPDEIARLADYLVVLEAGRVSAEGPIAQLLARLDLSLAHEPDAGALLEGTVAGHDAAYHLTLLDSAAGRFSVVRTELPEGHPVRLRIAARDVSLTLAAPRQTSIRNVFPATVDALTPEGPALVLVRLTVNGVALLARITRKSADELDLKPGVAVHAQVKSVALLR